MFFGKIVGGVTRKGGHVMFKTVSLELEARLSAAGDGTPETGSGKAEWKLYGDATQKLQVKLRRLSVADGATLYVSIANRPVGSVTVSDGRGQLIIEGGPGASVPEPREGDLLRVEAGSGVLLEGAFRRD